MEVLQMKKIIFKDTPHEDIATSHMNIGTIYKSMGDLKSALKYLEDSL
jgi:hypothetical protein